MKPKTKTELELHEQFDIVAFGTGCVFAGISLYMKEYKALLIITFTMLLRYIDRTYENWGPIERPIWMSWKHYLVGYVFARTLFYFIN